MKAIVCERYGPPEVLRFREIPKPEPNDDEILIRTHALSVNAGDCRVRALRLPAGFGLIGRLALGISRPRQPLLGSELAGEVESVGQNVKKFKIGDAVFAFTGAQLGCYAEYKCMRETGAVARIPSTLSFDEAVGIPMGGTTALSFLRKAGIQRGDRVLVIGASGGVGTATVQLSQHFGAEVTGVCGTASMELVRSLGASDVIDYTQQDFTRNGQRYDIIVDTTGTAPFRRCKNSLSGRGRLVLVSGSLPDLLQSPWVWITSNKRMFGGPASWRPDDVRFLAELAEAGKFRSIIDRRFPFDRVVEAHRYVESGHKKGNVVITLGQQGTQ